MVVGSVVAIIAWFTCVYNLIRFVHGTGDYLFGSYELLEPQVCPDQAERRHNIIWSGIIGTVACAVPLFLAWVSGIA